MIRNKSLTFKPRQPRPWPEDIEEMFHKNEIWCRPILAARIYLDRRNALSSPSLRSMAGLLLLSGQETAECCALVGPPDQKNRYRLARHACTMKHICTLIGTNVQDARAVLIETSIEQEAERDEHNRNVISARLRHRIDNTSISDPLIAVVEDLHPGMVNHIAEMNNIDHDEDRLVGRVVSQMPIGEQKDITEVWLKLDQGRP